MVVVHVRSLVLFTVLLVTTLLLTAVLHVVVDWVLPHSGIVAAAARW
jgi:hypothetical protein